MANFDITSHDGPLQGTDEPDLVTGTVHPGLGDISTLGGEDIVQIDRGTQTTGTSQLEPLTNFVGKLDGGAGFDTLSVGVAGTYDRANSNGKEGIAFSFRDIDVTGFEYLRTRWQAEISLDQLEEFLSIRGSPIDGFGSKITWLKLYGSGGELVPSIYEGRAIVDASELTSGLFFGAGSALTFTDTPFNDSIRTSGIGDWVTYTGGVDTYRDDGGIDTFEVIWEGAEALEISVRPGWSSFSNGTRILGFERYLMTGGEGNDELIVSSAYGAAGRPPEVGLNILRGGDGDDVLGGYHGDRLYGDDGNDRLTGGREAELFGGDGDDMTWLTTDSKAWGGEGNDRFFAEGGGSTILGQGGNDRLEAKGDNYNFVGGTGNDRVDIIGNANTVAGDSGNDLLFAEGQGNNLLGSVGDDRLEVVGSDNTAWGSSGDDRLFATGEENQLFGEAGADRLEATGSANRLYGGNNDDSLFVFGTGNELYGEAGADRLEATGSGNQLYGGANDDTAFVFGSGNEVHGDAGNDILIVKDAPTIGDNSLYGGDGNDRLEIIAGGGRMDGGAGDDVMIDGLGDDTFVVDRHGDRIIGRQDGGIDTVEVRYSYMLDRYLENLTLTGSADANGWGNDADNVLTGNSGDNRLNGLAGADRMTGGFGDDTYVVDNAGDRTIEGSGAGSDTVISFVTHALSKNVENLVLFDTPGGGAVNDFHGLGSDSANTLTGNSGRNMLTGRGGIDALTGGEGADKFRYLSTADSNAVTGMDRIVDFDLYEGDIVDVSAIDANEIIAGNQSFTTQIEADAAFTAAGQFRFSQFGNFKLAEFNVDANPDADLAIRFHGSIMPDAEWFIL